LTREPVKDHGSVTGSRDQSRLGDEVERVSWRAAARQLDLRSCLEELLSVVRAKLGVVAIELGRIDESRRIERYASVGAAPGAPLERARLEDLRDAPLIIGDPPRILALLDRSGARGEIVVISCERSLDVEELSAIERMIEPISIAARNAQEIAGLEHQRSSAEAETRALRARLENQATMTEAIIGEHGGLREVMERVDRVASSDVPVLLLGETGSGKEVIARAIHERSSRRNAALVRVNCGAIPSELVDSELFGHEKGAFTGALSTRKGWFERADGGTLLLDEIGELPLAAQVRLLRVLQEGTLERVGGHETLKVDVRIIAATHRNLPSMVGEGKFRDDLWYRLSVFPLQLPALRDRKEDLPLLAHHFAQKAGERLGNRGLEPSEEDLRLLARYEWPGNIRELGAVIERATILGAGKRLEVAQALGFASLGRTKKVSLPPPPPRYDLKQANISQIERALAETRGRIEGDRGAAALLGVNPHTLRARMRKLGIDWAKYRA
jgi:hydrogenase-4 transcriptional activator